MDKVEVVVAHDERATLRVGAVFVKVDADQRRLDVEVEAMAMAPVPTAPVLWRRPPALALAALPGRALGHLDEVTGILDWSEASQGDAHFDLATLTLGSPEHLDHVVAGYGAGVDRDVIRAWWSLRCLTNIRWLTEAGCHGPPDELPEVAVLRAQT